MREYGSTCIVIIHSNVPPEPQKRMQVSILTTSLLILLSIAVDASAEEAAQSASASGAGITRPFELRTVDYGEWGHLEYSRIILEPPDQYIDLSEDLKAQQNETVWKIAGNSIEDVSRVLLECGIPGDTITGLLEPTAIRRNEETGWFEIRPSDEIVLGLSADQRERLYPLLMPQTTKSPFFQPFALTPGGIREVSMIPTRLPDDTVNLIEELTYRMGRVKRFSDVNFLFARAENFEEKRRILKVLGRETSLSVRIVLSDESNLKGLEYYWSSGGRNREILPILRSVVRAPGVERLDIAHLLPPTPRKLIHTYPSPSGYGIAGDMPDCFWTAFSFFADDPPERHLDFTNHVFLERYEPTSPPFKLGDLILIQNEEEGTWIHACNYIAEELVFTKNGKSMGRPWIISHLSSVVESYLKDENVKATFYRLKPGYLR